MTSNPTHDHALAVIIGRAGSKGLPGKNSRLLGGRPMLCHTIDHVRAAETVDRAVVSTDCRHMTAVAGQAGLTVVPRPAALATDEATVDAAVRHAVEATDDRHRCVVILYANVPLRPAGLIDRAVHELLESGADSVQSYCPVGKHHPCWMTRLDSSGRVSAYVENAIYRRQDLPPVFIPDGGVIAVTRTSLFSIVEGAPHAFLGQDRRGIITEPGEVVDVDTAADLAVAEARLASGETCGAVG